MRSSVAGLLRNYLILSRIQTGAITAFTPVMAYLISHGYDNVIGPVFLYGLLMHMAIFSHNNLCDWERDPSYHSNPIARGLISPNAAQIFTTTVSWAALVVGLISTRSWYVVASFLSGLVYNWRSKKDLWAGVYLCGWIGFLYLSAMGSFTTTQGLVCIFGMSMLYVQWLEGAAKDRLTETNIYHHKLPYWLSLAIAKIAGGLCVILLLLSTIPLIGVALYPLLLALWFVGDWFSDSRERVLRSASIHEVLVYLSICISISVVLGPLTALVLFLIPLAWYVSFTWMLYGTPLRPKV